MITKPRLWALLTLAVVLTCVAPLIGTYFFDLDMYRVGGAAVLDAQPLYGARLGPMGFTYPPFAGLLSTVAALLPLSVAAGLMTVASLAALAVVLRHSAGDLLRAPTWRVVLGLAALACCAPVASTLAFGQVNLLLAAVVLADVHGRRWGGAGVGVAAAIKLTPGIFVLYLLVCGRRREAINAVMAFCAVTAGTWVLLPGDSTRFWLHEMFAESGIGVESSPMNQSLHGLVLRLVGDGPANAVWAPLALATAVIGLRIAARLTREGREPFALGVVGVTGCLVSPVSWMHHWVWAIPWLVGMAASARQPAAKAGVAVVGAVVVSWRQLMALAPSLPPLGTFLVDNAFVLCALGAALAYARPCTRPGGVLNLKLALGYAECQLEPPVRYRPIVVDAVRRGRRRFRPPTCSSTREDQIAWPS